MSFANEAEVVGFLPKNSHPDPAPSPCSAGSGRGPSFCFFLSLFINVSMTEIPLSDLTHKAFLKIAILGTSLVVELLGLGVFTVVGWVQEAQWGQEKKGNI